MANNKQNRFNLSMLEAQQSQLRAQYYAQRIAAGAFAQRLGKTFHGGLPENGGVPYTLSELLDDELKTMHRHVALAQEHIEYAKEILAELPI